MSQRVRVDVFFKTRSGRGLLTRVPDDLVRDGLLAAALAGEQPDLWFAL